MKEEQTQGTEYISYNAFVGKYNYPLKKASFKEVEYKRIILTT